MTRLWSRGVPIEITPGATGIPRTFYLWGDWWEITELCNRWRIRQGWWLEKGECWRDYHKVLTHQGMLCLLFHDLYGDTWSLERIYD